MVTIILEGVGGQNMAIWGLLGKRPCEQPPLFIIFSIHLKITVGTDMQKAKQRKRRKDYTVEVTFPPSTMQLASGSNYGDRVTGSCVPFCRA